LSQNQNFKGSEFVCGQTGMGKTSYIKREILPNETRCLVYDHMAEYTSIPGYSYFSDWDKLVSYLERNQKGFCRAIYIPLEASEDEFALVCRVPFATQGLTIVTDELDQYATPISFPVEFKRIIHFGRHFGTRFVGGARRASDVARAFTSQCYKIVAFRQSEPRDIVYLRSIVGDDAQRLPDLEPLHYLSFEQGNITEGEINFGGKTIERRQEREDSESRRYSETSEPNEDEIRESDSH
jgi:hypothetical protein